MRGSFLITRVPGLLLIVFLVSGCAAKSPSAGGWTQSPNSPVWPAPPAEPRIAFLTSIEKPEDFGIRSSWYKRTVGLLTGKKGAGEPFVKPFSLYFDQKGDLCLTDTGSNTVFLFEFSKKRYRQYAKAGSYSFIKPVAIAKKGDLIYVGDTGRNAVLVFDTKGKFHFQIEEGLKRPAGLTISGEKLYVADALQHVVYVFDLKGKPLFKIGERGTQVAQFNFPTDLATDAGGNLFVNDSGNGRIQRFTGDGKFQAAVGGLGDGTGYFSRPKSVAVDSARRVYVTDALYDNFQIFDDAGRFLLAVGSAGSDHGEFWMPGGVAINHRSEIYVADPYNSRIQVFGLVGEQ